MLSSTRLIVDAPNPYEPNPQFHARARGYQICRVDVKSTRFKARRAKPAQAAKAPINRRHTIYPYGRRNPLTRTQFLNPTGSGDRRAPCVPRLRRESSAAASERAAPGGRRRPGRARLARYLELRLVWRLPRSQRCFRRRVGRQSAPLQHDQKLINPLRWRVHSEKGSRRRSATGFSETWPNNLARAPR